MIIESLLKKCPMEEKNKLEEVKESVNTLKSTLNSSLPKLLNFTSALEKSLVELVHDFVSDLENFLLEKHQYFDSEFSRVNEEMAQVVILKNNLLKMKESLEGFSRNTTSILSSVRSQDFCNYLNKDSKSESNSVVDSNSLLERSTVCDQFFSEVVLKENSPFRNNVTKRSFVGTFDMF